MIHIARTVPLIATGAGAAWLAPTSGWFVIAVQVVIVDAVRSLYVVAFSYTPLRIWIRNCDAYHGQPNRTRA